MDPMDPHTHMNNINFFSYYLSPPIPLASQQTFVKTIVQVKSFKKIKFSFSSLVRECCSYSICHELYLLIVGSCNSLMIILQAWMFWAFVDLNCHKEMTN